METTPPSSSNRAPAPPGTRGRNGREDGETLLPLPAAPAGPVRPRTRAARRARRAWPGWERVTRLLLAFAIASLLWVYVLNLENPINQQTFSGVPLTARGLGANQSLASDLGSVSVVVQAPQDVLNRLRPADFSPYVDLAGHDPGSYDLPVNVNTPKDTFGVTVEPAQVHVEVIEVREQPFDVTVRRQGVPALGYQIETQQVRPDSVVVRGPPSQLARIDQVVADVNVEGRQATQQDDVPPRALDTAGHEIAGLQFNPTTVTVVVAIQQLLNLKTLPIHVPVEGAPAAGFGATDIVVQPTTLTVFGPPNTLETLDLLETKPVSIRGATETVSATVPVSLPKGLTLYPPGTANQVQVRVAVAELSTRTQLSVLVEKVGLEPGLLAIISPDRVDITLSGPFDALQDLKPDDIQATLLLTGYGVGTYRVTPAITVPPRTSLLGQPSAVTVTISGPPTVTPAPLVPTVLTPAFLPSGSGAPPVLPGSGPPAAVTPTPPRPTPR